jgi:hypothetical protein
MGVDEARALGLIEERTDDVAPAMVAKRRGTSASRRQQRSQPRLHGHHACASFVVRARRSTSS